MLALLTEAAYFVAGVAMFLVFCVGFYLVWLVQTEVVVPFFANLL